MTGANAPTFLCDEMLHGLARWLRAAGYDAVTEEPGTPDAVLVARAGREGRFLLTRDRAMLQRRGASRHVVMLSGQSTDLWAGEMRRRLGLAWWHAPFTRCLICNTPLEMHPSLPERAEVTGCPTCRKVYWPGSHTRRMAERLKAWQAGDCQAATA
jgi:uncharacterized protein with PIN domain